MNDDFTNPNWRLTNLYRITNKDGDKVIFNPNSIQQKVLDNKNKKKIVLKARQFGISTVCILQLLDYVLWNDNATACILAHEKDAIKKLFKIVKYAYAELPDDLKPELDRGGGSMYEYYFPKINSRIYCDLESRGDTIHRLHISEMAFIKEVDRVNATLQTVPLNGHVTMETTPNGMGNHFYKLWRQEDQIYTRLFFPWFMHDEYWVYVNSFIPTDEEKEFMIKAKKNYDINISREQMAFRRLKKEELGDMFIQEYPEDDYTCFLSTGNAALSLDKVSKIEQSDRPILRTVNEIKIYKERVSTKMYIVGADPAEGVGNDYSVAVMLDVETREEVAFVRGQYEPFAFAHKLNEMCEMYRGQHKFPLLVVEQNNHGHAVLLELIRHVKYPNIYYRKDNVAGWRTDLVTRPIMIDTFIDAVHNDNIIINSDEIINECFTLINNNGKIQAAPNEHDDCVVALAICLKVLVDRYKTIQVYNDIGNKIRI